MAFYADKKFPLRVIEELRRLGHDVLTAFEDGRANQSITDQEILARATEQHAGIIICTEDPDRMGQARRIAEAITEARDVRAKLIRVYRQK